jgi:deoxycytidine triphosphate deaminase/outer membrane murein-binding lipoprotein Lpp
MSTNLPAAGPNFATSDQEAAERFAQTRGKDPFPGIHPALLNTADLLDYVAETGLIFPFELPPSDRSELLKPASCGIRLAGDYVYWDTGPDGKPLKVEGTLTSGEELVLKKNSIVYVTLEPMLRLPDYIAARFNLTIRDIYRGILVGTGPLVDPGFTGRLSLPLHNLTFNDYPIKAGEPIVWMEFTKISSNDEWAGDPGDRPRRGAYEQFPRRKKKRRNVHDYLHYAYPGPITSSIPPLLGKANASAAAAESAVKRQQRIFTAVSIPTAVVIVVTIAAVLLQVIALVNDSNNDRQDLTRQVDALTREVKELKADEQAAKKPEASHAAPPAG